MKNISRKQGGIKKAYNFDDFDLSVDSQKVHVLHQVVLDLATVLVLLSNGEQPELALVPYLVLLE